MLRSALLKLRPIVSTWIGLILTAGVSMGVAAQTLDDMHVVGIVTGDSNTADYALISHRNNDPEIYHAGDQIVPGITLEKIFTDRIRAKSGSSIVEIKLGSPFAGDASDFQPSPSPAMDYATAPEPTPIMEPEPSPEPPQEMTPPDAPPPSGQENAEVESSPAPESGEVAAEPPPQE